jgi:hypothetical protein
MEHDGPTLGDILQRALSDSAEINLRIQKIMKLNSLGLTDEVYIKALKELITDPTPSTPEYVRKVDMPMWLSEAYAGRKINAVKSLREVTRGNDFDDRRPAIGLYEAKQIVYSVTR